MNTVEAFTPHLEKCLYDNLTFFKYNYICILTAAGIYTSEPINAWDYYDIYELPPEYKCTRNNSFSQRLEESTEGALWLIVNNNGLQKITIRNNTGSTINNVVAGRCVIPYIIDTDL